MAREAGPGSGKTFACARDCRFGELLSLTIYAERDCSDSLCAILDNGVARLLDGFDDRKNAICSYFKSCFHCCVLCDEMNKTISHLYMF
jgi:hypothetical protein